MMRTAATTLECNDCGRYHPTGAAVIYCDWMQERTSPAVTDERQSSIAREFATSHPSEALRIEDGLRHGGCMVREG